MRSGWPNALKLIVALALMAGLAMLPAFSHSSATVVRAEGQASPARAKVDTVIQPQVAAAAVPAVRKAAKAPYAPPAQAAVPPGQEKKEEPQPTPAAPAVPRISALDPDLPGPTNLDGTYYPQGWGNSRNAITWTKASPDTTVNQYVIPEWSSDSFASMVTLFNQLATYLDTDLARDAAQIFVTHTTQAMQPGLTVTERQDIADLIEFDLDALFAIIIDHTADPVVQGYWDDLLLLATVDYANKSHDQYTSKKLVLEKYYFYVVLAEHTGDDTSPPSNSWGMFAYDDNGPTPAQPTGFTATAYDPGVALEWDPNTEMDLDGYNVYELQGGTPVQLNADLITYGTEYFHMTGTVGATYYVEAVNMAGLDSADASAVSVLAKATIYDADNPAWGYYNPSPPQDAWAREDYSAIETGGAVLRVGGLTGATASLTFTGRRVKVYSARYWSCGNVNFYIDGELEDTFNLFYDGGYVIPPDPYKPALWQQEVFVITGLSKGSHTLTVECVGSGGGYGENYINFDYAEVR